MNPSLAAAREGWQAALARIPQAGAWPDPMLSYSVAPLTVGSGMPFGQVVELQQALPFPGKLSLRAEVAGAEAAAARGELEGARLRLAVIASNLFDDYVVVHRALVINEEHLALLQTLKKSAEAQYVVGRASQRDALQAEVELTELLHQQVMLQTRRDSVRAQLNGLLHRPPESPLPPPSLEEQAGQSAPTDTASLQEQALRARPELEALRARLGGGDAAVRLARREYWPDLSVMGSYNSMWPALPHQLMAGVSINLPLQLGRRKAAVDEAQARLRGLRHEEQRLIDEIRVEVEQARLGVLEAVHGLHLFEARVMPAMTDRAAAARAGFESGRNDFRAVLEAERQLRTARLRLEELRADVHRRRAELARAIGVVPGSDGGAK